MSFLKKPFQKLKEKAGRSSSDLGDSDHTIKEEVSNGHGGLESPNGSAPDETRRQSREVLREQKARRSMDKEKLKIEALKRTQLSRIESENFRASGPPELTKLYKPYSMNMSKNWNHENRVLFKDIDWARK